MTLSYDIYFNSGEINQVHYQKGNNVSLIEINNSDQDYYQNAIIELFDCSTQSVNDKVLVKINDVDQLNGYICRKSSSIKGGKKLDTYQVVGKTFDLWRYVTDNNAIYSGTTSFIISSMIGRYCTCISSSRVYVNSGTLLTSEKDFSNTIVGDAIIQLAQIDGYSFYVDNESNFIYYNPGESTYLFTVNESDIIDMDGLEESDEDLVNDCRVVGGTDYSVITNSSTISDYDAIPNGRYIASKFKAEDSVLSAIKLYLGRSTGDNKPATSLSLEIWENASLAEYEEDFDNYTNLDEDTKASSIEEHYSMLMMSGQEVYTTWPTYEGTATHFRDKKYHAQTFMITGCGQNNVLIPGYTKLQVRKVKATPYANDSEDLGNYTLELRKCTKQTQVDGSPTTIILASGSYNLSQTHSLNIYTINLHPPAYISSNTLYALVTHKNDLSRNPFMMCDYTNSTEPGHYISGRTWSSDNGSSWSVFYVNGIDWKFWVYADRCGTFCKTGSIKSKFEKTNYDINSILISASILSGSSTISNVNYISPDYIGFSGTVDSGVHWSGLVLDEYTKCWGAGGSGLKIGIFLHSTMIGGTPVIESIKYKISSSTGTGYPVSSEKIEWSDDISWSATDIPYPPSFSAWKTYSLPKLQLTTGDYYWLVLSHPSASLQYWSYYYDGDSPYADGDVLYADAPYQGADWERYSPDRGSLTFKLGWTQGEITARASNQTSIDKYGRHFRMINDTNITTQEQADNLAEATVYGSDNITKRGTFTINGRETMGTNYKISSNLPNFNYSGSHEIVSYTQTIDNVGFKTNIAYGKQPFDITKKLTDLESKLYGSD